MDGSLNSYRPFEVAQYLFTCPGRAYTRKTPGRRGVIPLVDGGRRSRVMGLNVHCVKAARGTGVLP